MGHRVFVFGTLKEGFPNFSVNKGIRVPGSYRTRERFPLYLVGERHVPWMLDARGQGEQVAGEVYDVDDATLAAMDRLERVGEPEGYLRVAITVDAGGGPLQAFAYLKPASQLAPDVPRVGPFAEYTLEHASLYRSRNLPEPA